MNLEENSKNGVYFIINTPFIYIVIKENVDKNIN